MAGNPLAGGGDQRPALSWQAGQQSPAAHDGLTTPGVMDLQLIKQGDLLRHVQLRRQGPDHLPRAQAVAHRQHGLRGQLMTSAPEPPHGFHLVGGVNQGAIHVQQQGRSP